MFEMFRKRSLINKKDEGDELTIVRSLAMRLAVCDNITKNSLNDTEKAFVKITMKFVVDEIGYRLRRAKNIIGMAEATLSMPIIDGDRKELEKEMVCMKEHYDRMRKAKIFLDEDIWRILTRIGETEESIMRQ